MNPPFFMHQYHPGSFLARKLESKCTLILSHYSSTPKKLVQLLSQEYGFGSHSSLWDEFIFRTVLARYIESSIISLADLPLAFNRAAALDEALFLPFFRREEDPLRFRSAFWSFATTYLRLHQKLSAEYLDTCFHKDKILYTNVGATHESDQCLAFVFKGPFALAHSEFLHSYLVGCKKLTKPPTIYLILIDDNLVPTRCDHISIISLSAYKTSFGKYQALYYLSKKIRFTNIIWVACIQTLGMYMGRRLAPIQTYWSMKYHSILLPSIDLYAGLGFGGSPFKYDGQEWFRGRAFPLLSMPPPTENQKSHIKSKYRIPHDAIVIGAFVRAEKLHNSQYWSLLKTILESYPHVHFVLASQKLSPEILALSRQLPVKQYTHLGWIDTKHYISCLDIYVDSFPRGSCNTIFEAWHSKVPSIIYDSPHNRESSALPYIIGALPNVRQGSLEEYGVVANPTSYLSILSQLILSPEARLFLSKEQHKVYEILRSSNHFAADYTAFFVQSVNS